MVAPHRGRAGTFLLVAVALLVAEIAGMLYLCRVGMSAASFPFPGDYARGARPFVPVPAVPRHPSLLDEPLSEPFETDPWRRASASKRRYVELGRDLRNYDLAVADREPFLVFVVRAGFPDADAAAAKALDLLQAIYREVLGKLGPPLSLKPLAELADDDMRALCVLLMSPETFRRYHMFGSPLREGANSRYSAGHRRLTIRLPAAGKAWDQQTVRAFSLVVAQLLHVWGKATLEASLGARVSWDDRRLRSRLEFVATGLPLLLGGCRERPGGKYEFGLPDEQGLAEWAAMRAQQVPEWTLPKLLGIRTYPQPIQTGAQRREELLFVAQSATFCHFLCTGRAGSTARGSSTT